MWKQFWTASLSVMAATIVGSAQGPSPSQNPASIAIVGCLEGGQGGFAITDPRSTRRYRLEAPAEMLSWHVGHEVEIHGTFQSGSTSEMPTLKVTEVIYVSKTCSQGGGKGN